MSDSPRKSRRRLVIYVGVLLLLVGAVAFWRPKLLAPKASNDDAFFAASVEGKNAFENADAEKALPAFERAVQLAPTVADAHLNLANALLLAGRSEEAIAAGRKALELEKNSAAALYVVGCSHLRLGQSDEALKALQQSQFIEPGVSAVSFQIGRAQQALGRWEDAATAYRETVNLEPEHAAAHYALSQVLIRMQQMEAAQAELKIHQAIGAKRPNTPADATVFEKSKHTAARLPNLKPEQPDAQGIGVKFTDATSLVLGEAAARYHGPLALLDVQGDGTRSLFAHEKGAGFRLLALKDGKVEPAGDPLPLDEAARYTRCLVGDLNNDRLDDLLVLGEGGAKVFKLGKDGGLTDVSVGARLKDLRATTGLLADLEFTGALGVVAVSDGALAIRRNQGNISFSDRTAAFKLPALPAAARQCVMEDWNGDDLPDLFVVLESGPPMLLLNQHGGPFKLGGPDAPRIQPMSGAAPSPAPPSHPWPAGRAIALGDVNGDLRADLAVATASGIEIVFGGLDERAAITAADVGDAHLALVDYDNDGWLDVVAWGTGVRVWRNLGRTSFRETTSELGLADARGPIESFVAGDIDVDGDTDLLVTTAERGLQFFRNDGGSANRQLKMRFVGRRTNASGLGARVELVARGWRTSRTFHEPWLEIGAGTRERLDSVAVHSADIVMNLGSVEADPKTPLHVTELELPTGSCPYLYAWDGAKFRFITDLLGAAPAGLRLTDERFIDADTDELVGIGDDTTLQPRDGAYELQITDELRELFFFDHVQLVVADHPPEAEVHSTSKLRPGKPFVAHELVALGARRPLVRAIRSNGIHGSHTTDQSDEVTSALAEVDGEHVSPLALRAPQLRGLAEPYSLALDFGPLETERPLVLALTGWLRFGGGMANVAASHDPTLPFPFPQLEAEVAGAWQPVDVVVGAPAGKTKTIIVDLAGKLPAGASRLRISTAFEIHWDRIALFERVGTENVRETRLEPAVADLHWHGSGEHEPWPWFLPVTPIHAKVRPAAPWQTTPAGWCTRYGDVRELITAKDNALAIMNCGDELTVRFPTAALPPKTAGTRRSFFLFTSGWDKDADYHVEAGATVEPIPWHGMDDQRYGQQPRPAFENDAWMEKYNTRWVGPLTLTRRSR